MCCILFVSGGENNVAIGPLNRLASNMTRKLNCVGSLGAAEALSREIFDLEEERCFLFFVFVFVFVFVGIQPRSDETVSQNNAFAHLGCYMSR